MDISFIIECYSFITQNRNPFSRERKFSSVTAQYYVNMMWQKCIPNSVFKFICCKKNFMLLNQLELTYQKGIQNEKKTEDLHLYFQKFQLISNTCTVCCFLNTLHQIRNTVLKINQSLSTLTRNGSIPRKASTSSGRIVKLLENCKNRSQSTIEDFEQKTIMEKETEKEIERKEK